MNPETEFVLKKFQANSPQYIAHVMTQVRDMEIRETEGVDGSMSLKRAWEMMRDLGVVTLPITENNKLKGLITISDIATAIWMCMIIKCYLQPHLPIKIYWIHWMVKWLWVM